MATAGSLSRAGGEAGRCVSSAPQRCATCPGPVDPITALRKYSMFVRPELNERLVDGMRLAALPE